MLVSLTRIGASRQRLDKTFAVVGTAHDAVARALAQADLRLGGQQVGVTEGAQGSFSLRLPLSWLGTRPARDELFTELGTLFGAVAAIVARAGGALVPAGVAPQRTKAVPGGDVHVLEVLSSVEQEVLCNVLRSWVPTLIALTGTGTTTSAAPPDRIGSRWLAGSNTHLSARFLDSTAPDHLDRVRAELRRDGIVQLDRMDVAPVGLPDGTPAVVVRCTDAAVTLAGVRAQTLLMSALAMHARRLVRDGRRAVDEPQRLLEENRARAITDGLRARFRLTERRRGSVPEKRAARESARQLLRELSVEFRNLDADPAELAPFLFALDLAGLGLRHAAAERDLLGRWAAAGDAELLARCHRALTDPVPGGPLLAELTASAPGRVAVVLGEWRRGFAEAEAGVLARRGDGV